MNNKSITPSFQKPVVRFASGQLPSALAELSEAVLSSDVLPLSRWSGDPRDGAACSYDGSDD
jgi:bacteriocin leader peptide (microcyclamide/patellamide family)